MKRFSVFIVTTLTAAALTNIQANAMTTTLAATIDVYVFPKSGQSTSQQSQDEVSCYEWATSKVGTDPFKLSKQADQQESETVRAKSATEQEVIGSGAKGAMRGAAAGAIIGEIANDDAGKGAAIGAGTGAIVSRRRARIAQQREVEQVEHYGQTQQQATKQQVENFKKAFAVCLEAKEYLVKF